MQVKGRFDLPQEKIVKAYTSFLSKDRDPMLFDSRIYDMMMKYSLDVKQVEEVVAQADSINYSTSKYEYGQIEEQIQRFEMENVKYFGYNRNLKRAKARILKEMAGVHLKSLVYEGNDDIIDRLPKKDAHAGFSFLVTGLRTKGEYSEDIFPKVLKLEEEAKKKGRFDLPIMIASRTQASIPFSDDDEFTGESKNKSRLVAMEDIHLVSSEMRFARPVQDAMSELDWYVGGKSDSQINVMLNQARRSYYNWLSIDYSGYDQSVSSWLIMEAFDIIRELFREDENFDESLFKAVTFSFCNKEFIDGDGNLRKSVKGIPSGSMFTQIIGTLVNRLMILTYCESQDIQDIWMTIMGDDNIMYTRTPIDREHLESYLNANFGVKVNGSKSSSGLSQEDPEFLSRKWSFDGGYRPKSTLILKMAYPERYRDYAKGYVLPEVIIYSYILAYGASMHGMIDIPRFYRDFPNLSNKLKELGTQGLSGYLRYQIEYLGLRL